MNTLWHVTYVLFIILGVGRIAYVLFRVSMYKRRLKPITWRACWRIEYFDHWSWNSRI